MFARRMAARVRVRACVRAYAGVLDGAASIAGAMSAGKSARLFVAIDPPVSVREALATWARAAAAALRSPVAPDGRERSKTGQLRILDAETMHVTLCFLGSRPTAEIDTLADAIDELAEHPAPELSLGAPVWLPPRRPRALAVEVHDVEHSRGRLDALVADVVRAITGTIDWQPERRRFRGHVTVARTRSGPRSPRRSSASDVKLPPTPQRSFRPERVVLYRSWLAPTGATYEALAGGPLRAADA